MKQSMFYFACIIAHILSKDVFISKTTLMEGQQLDVECNALVFGNSIPNITCVSGLSLGKFNSTTKKFDSIVELYEIEAKDYINNLWVEWWNISASLNYSENNCNNVHMANIKAFVKAVRFEDSGLYRCHLETQSTVDLTDMYYKINGSLTVIQKNAVKEEVKATSTQTSLKDNNNGVTEKKMSTTPMSGAIDKCKELKAIIIVATLAYVWQLGVI